MSYNQYYINISMLLVFFGVGVWEAIIASNHQPDHTKLTDYEKEGYAFTVVRSVINILFGVFGTCHVMIKSDKSKDDEKKSNMAQFHCLNLGTTIWCVIMYSDIINHHLDFGPFKQVIVAEFIIFITSVCLIVFSCCVFITFISVIKAEVPTNNHSTSITNSTEKLRNTLSNTDQLQVTVTEVPVSGVGTKSPIINESVSQVANVKGAHMIDIVVH